MEPLNSVCLHDRACLWSCSDGGERGRRLEGDGREASDVPGRVLVALHGVGARERFAAGAHEGALPGVTPLVDAQVVAPRERRAALLARKRLDGATAGVASVVAAVSTFTAVAAAAATGVSVEGRARFVVAAELSCAAAAVVRCRQFVVAEVMLRCHFAVVIGNVRDGE